MIHTLGLWIGSVFLALVLLALGDGLRAMHASFIAGASVIFASGLVLLQLSRRRPVQSRWQVPEVWRRLLPMDMLAFVYGVLLGIGVLTAVVLSAFWVLVATTLVTTPATAISAWSLFAFARGASFYFAALRNRGIDLLPARVDTLGRGFL